MYVNTSTEAQNSDGISTQFLQQVQGRQATPMS